MLIYLSLYDDWRTKSVFNYIFLCSFIFHKITVQIASLTCDKHDLELRVSRLESEKTSASEQVRQLQHTMQQLNEDLTDRECKITSYYNKIEVRFFFFFFFKDYCLITAVNSAYWLNMLLLVY